MSKKKKKKKSGNDSNEGVTFNRRISLTTTLFTTKIVSTFAANPIIVSLCFVFAFWPLYLHFSLAGLVQEQELPEEMKINKIQYKSPQKTPFLLYIHSG